MNATDTLKSTSINEKASFTADVVAFARTFSGIPLCQTIFEIVERIAGPLDPAEKARAEARPVIFPYMEARYLLTDDELEARGIGQIFELASGLSPRGFLATDDPHVEYVEMDLPDKMALKRKIIEELHRRQGTADYRNLHLLEGSGSNSPTRRCARN